MRLPLRAPDSMRERRAPTRPYSGDDEKRVGQEQPYASQGQSQPVHLFLCLSGPGHAAKGPRGLGGSSIGTVILAAYCIKNPRFRVKGG